MLDMKSVVFDALNLKPRKHINAKGEVEVPCPYNPNRYVEVNLHNNGFKCWSICADCPVNGKGGPVNFAKLAFPTLKDKQVTAKIYNILNGETFTPKEIQVTELKPQSVKANLDIIDETYRNFLDKLVLSEKHLNDLLKRGLSVEDIQKIGFKSLPEKKGKIAQQLLLEGNVLKGVPGFYFSKNKPMINCNSSGYFIPYKDRNGKIIALQIRNDVKITEGMSDEDIADAKKMRYRWFTSSSEEAGCGASNVPYYGIIPEDKKVVYITEGGLKASVAQSLSGKWFTAIPGISCYSAVNELFQYFEDCGVEKVIDTFDSDRKTNPNVNNSIENIKEIAMDYNFEFITWSWGTEFKGIDDYLLDRRNKRK